MKKTTIISLGILSLSTFLLAGCVSNPEADQAIELSKSGSEGIIEIIDNDQDLGTIPIQGGKVDSTFTFRNVGTGPIALLQAETTCMCTEAVVEANDGTLSPRIKMRGHGLTAQVNQVLEPNEEATLTATFDPMAHGPNGVGPIMRTVIVRTNSKITPKLEFNFEGNVVY